MAVTAFYYGNFMNQVALKTINLDTDNIKVSLHTSTYTPNQDTHDFYNDVTNEVAASGTYAAGGSVLANTTLTYTGATNVFKFDADDVAWTGTTITARYAVVYDSTPGTAATNPLILYVDFGADVISTAGTFTITWDAAGLATITVA